MVFQSTFYPIEPLNFNQQGLILNSTVCSRLQSNGQ